MAATVTRVTHKINAYRNVARPAPASDAEVAGTRALSPVSSALAQAQLPGVGQPAPYVNALGQTTGTVINTTA